MDELQVGRVLMFVLALAVVGFAPHETLSQNPPTLNQTLPGCNSTCGNVQIPYPFGIGNSSTPSQAPCFINPQFELTCNDSTLLTGTVPVLDINVLTNQMDVMFHVARDCTNGTKNNPFLRISSSFTISSNENKLLTVGADSYGYVNSFFNGESYSTGCLTRSYGNTMKMSNGTCSGIGCCQADVPPGMRNITVYAKLFTKLSSSPESTLISGDCSNSFVVKNGYYNFSTTDLQSFRYKKVPLVLDWSIGNKSCIDSESGPNYACKENSYCDDKDSEYGYICRCLDGYQGNPYIGCTDIDECMTRNNTCISYKNCRNTNGSYTCFCYKWWQFGNGTKERGCRIHSMVFIGAALGFVIVFGGFTALYLIYQKKKLVKLKRKFFQQNGGLILLQKLSRRGDTSQTAQIFTEEELMKATNNFDESLIIGRGGFGTVFKGFLADNRIVAIKKSKIVNESHKEQFINEVIVLSQVNHRNVVKLLGCCLEREVPLLVYEFVNNGTLFDLIHTEKRVNNETWETRLRIAAEAAEALSYLHSAASIPIIHRDVKTANILLDDAYTAKVSDFGASRLVPLDQTEIATIVQGTFGYLDPEYMLTNQLTEKSDVYSFGAVLVELLTGEKPHCFGRPEEKRSLANHFLSCLKEDRLFDVLQVGIVNGENKKDIMEAAILAAKCLRLNGEERPTMKEVAIELNAIRQVEKHPWINRDANPEETEYLLRESSSSIHKRGDSTSHQYTGYDSIKDHVLVPLDDGR